MKIQGSLHFCTLEWRLESNDHGALGRTQLPAPLQPQVKFVVVHFFSQRWGVSARDAKASPYLGRSGGKTRVGGGGVGRRLQDNESPETRKLPAFPFLAYGTSPQGQTLFPECHVGMLPPCCPPPDSPSLEPLDGCVSTDSELIKSYLSSTVDTAQSRLACADACVPRGLQEILCPNIGAEQTSLLPRLLS